MNLNEIIATDKAYYMNTFGDRTPVCFEYGKGISLYSTDGKEYKDFMSGIAVSSLGHSHPKLVSALKEQAQMLLHTSSLYYIKQQAMLAKELCDSSCADKAFFCNSGAEANEGAIKLVKNYFYKKDMPHKSEIITLINSFHGRTLTTVAATGQEKYQKPYKPLTPGFIHVPINDINILKQHINNNTAAIMLELVQGEGGVYPIDTEYLKEVKRLCEDNEIILVYDEIQTGIGRTGKLFGYQSYGVEPDIFTLAKGLGGGIPIGAICAKDFVAVGFVPGDHGTTFGGNPFCCSAGLAVLAAIKDEGLVENAYTVGQYAKECLESLKLEFPEIIEVRGLGLMLGIELTEGLAATLHAKLFEKGYLTGCIAGKILRILPPLIVTKADIDGFINTLKLCIKEIK